VIVADLDPVGGERVANYHEHNMHFIKMNVAKEEDWESCLENTLAKFGRVDICVNNAGTSYKNKVSFTSLILMYCRGRKGKLADGMETANSGSN
jgi:NAD(P)-dependent dehydrogenase (short-subunit alcohol dehydrogenase family)